MHSHVNLQFILIRKERTVQLSNEGLPPHMNCTYFLTAVNSGYPEALSASENSEPKSKIKFFNHSTKSNASFYLGNKIKYIFFCKLRKFLI